MPDRLVLGLRPHDAASLVPPMPEPDYRDLLADVRAHGVVTPLDVLADGRVLDGRSRLRAATEAKVSAVPVRVLDMDEAEAAEHILRTAILRRHLTPSQRAALVASGQELVARLRAEARGHQGTHEQEDPPSFVATLPPGRVNETLAPLAQVSPRLMADVLTAREDPAVFAEVVAGRLPAHRAAARIRQARADAAATARVRGGQIPSMALAHHGDFRDHGDLIADGTVDLILTVLPRDPAIGAAVAGFAARKLARGGALVALAGPREVGAMAATAAGLVAALCPPGGLVCDPLCGAGAILEAAVRAGRRAVGFDADVRMADAAGGRLVAAVEDLAGIAQIGGMR